MEKTKNGKKYALIAAIFFAVYFAVYTVLSICVDVYYYFIDLDFSAKYEISIDYSFYIWEVLSDISFVLITVALFCKSKKFLIVGTAANVLLDIISYVLNRLQGYNTTLGMIYILRIAAYVVLILLVVQSVRKSDSIIKMIWFLPSLIILVYNITYYTIYSSEFSGDLFENFIDVIKFFAIIFEVVALLFIGIWLKASTPAPVKKNIPLTGGADKLREYKRLLDSGMISKEEFEEKKREILNS